jgi:hypothetical protein
VLFRARASALAGLGPPPVALLASAAARTPAGKTPRDPRLAAVSFGM